MTENILVWNTVAFVKTSVFHQNYKKMLVVVLSNKIVVVNKEIVQPVAPIRRGAQFILNIGSFKYAASVVVVRARFEVADWIVDLDRRVKTSVEFVKRCAQHVS